MAYVRVLVTDYAWPDLAIETAVLERVGAAPVVAPVGPEEVLIAAAAGVQAILTCWRPVTSRVLDAATDCHTVGRYGVGLDNIDVGRATELGIVVSNVPGFCRDEVADHALLLVLALNRQLVTETQNVHSGGWAAGSNLPRRLRGLTFGLLGLGTIARAVAVRAQAVGMTVVAWQRGGPRADDPTGVEAVDDLDEVLRRSDVVSLHLPSTSQTRGLIGARELELMRSDALLVNTGRGDLVDTDAVLQALDRGLLGGVGLDVTSPEPLPERHPLRTHERAILTPHTAFKSDGAINELAASAAANVAEVLSGSVPASVVNPEVLDSPNLRMSR